MNAKTVLRERAFACEMDYFAVAPAARFIHLPKGRRPEDLLSGARSVIVMGRRIPQGPLTAHENAFEGKRIHILSFTMYAVNKINNMLNQAALKIARQIEREYGELAMPVPAGEPHDEENWQSVFPNRMAAYCAGLGDLGWNGFVLTPDAGPRVMWVSLITTLDLDADPVYNGERLCDHTRCNVCVEVCPVFALSSRESLEVDAVDAKAEVGLRNKPLCRCAVKGLVKGTPGRLQNDIPHNNRMQTMEDWYQLTKKDDPWQRMEFNHGNYCLRCMTQCPAGRKDIADG